MWINCSWRQLLSSGVPMGLFSGSKRLWVPFLDHRLQFPILEILADFIYRLKILISLLNSMRHLLHKTAKARSKKCLSKTLNMDFKHRSWTWTCMINIRNKIRPLWLFSRKYLDSPPLIYFSWILSIIRLKL